MFLFDNGLLRWAGNCGTQARVLILSGGTRLTPKDVAAAAAKGRWTQDPRTSGFVVSCPRQALRGEVRGRSVRPGKGRVASKGTPTMRTFFHVSGLWLAWSVFVPCLTAAEPRPNILYIMAD